MCPLLASSGGTMVAMQSMRCIGNLGKSAQHWKNRQDVQEDAEGVTLADARDQISQGSNRACDGNEANARLRDGSGSAQFLIEIAPGNATV
jgi:hypothetical protein